MSRTHRRTLATLTVLAGIAGIAVAGCSGSEPEEPAVADAVAASQEVTAFCEAAKGNVAAARPIADLSAKGPAPHPEDEVVAALAPLRDSNRKMLDTAPAEVRPDAQLAFELAEMQLDIYQRTGGDPRAVSTDPVYDAKVREADPALERMRAFLRTACGVDAG
jgi:hypothetical protein